MVKTDYYQFFKDVKNWQINVLGNNCTICHGNNINNVCDACGFWGKVIPSNWPINKKQLELMPKISNYQTEIK
jgi:hypothetical protein